MKKKQVNINSNYRVFPVLVVLILLANCILSFAMADGSHKNKKAVEIPGAFLFDNKQENSKYILYYGQEGGIDAGFRLNGEELIEAKVELISGDKNAEEALKIDTFDFESETEYSWEYNPSLINEPGEATFAIRLESEHYYFEGEITYVFKSYNDAGINLKGNVINIPLNKSFNGSTIVDNGLIVPSDPLHPSCYIIPEVEVFDSFENDDYKIEFGNITFKRDGDYQFDLEVDMAGFSTRIPIVFHTDSSIKEISASGESRYISAASDINNNIQTTSQPEETEPETTESQSAESLLSDIFGSEEEDDDDSETDTSVLNSLAKEEEEYAEDTSTMTEEDIEKRAVGLGKEVLDSGNVSTKSIDTNDLLNVETYQESVGVFQWPIPNGISNPQVMSMPYSEDKKAEITQMSYKDTTGRITILVTAQYTKTNYYSDKANDNQSAYDAVISQIKQMYTTTPYIEEEIKLDGNYSAYVIGQLLQMVSKDTYEVSNVLSIFVIYSRGCNSLLTAQYCINGEKGELFDEKTLPTVEQLMPFISKISYSVPEDHAGVPDWLITADDFALAVTMKPDKQFMPSGSSAKLKVKYTRKDLANRVANLVPPELYVLDAEAFARQEFKPADESIARINAKGELKVGTVKEPKEVIVMATCQHAATSWQKSICILPKIKSITLGEKKRVMTLGDSPIVLTAETKPANAIYYPQEGEGSIVWSCSNPDIVSVTDNRDGTATVEAKAKGSAKVTVTDQASGKKAVTTIKVKE